MPLRLLGAMTVLFGINTFVSVILMIARNRPGEFTRPAVIVFVQNVVFNFILIPPLGRRARRSTRSCRAPCSPAVTLRLARGLVRQRSRSPCVRRAACWRARRMAAFALITGTALNVLSVGAAVAVYLVALLVLERVLFPDDFRFYAELVPDRVRA